MSDDNRVNERDLFGNEPDGVDWLSAFVGGGVIGGYVSLAWLIVDGLWGMFL